MLDPKNLVTNWHQQASRYRHYLELGLAVLFLSLVILLVVVPTWRWYTATSEKIEDIQFAVVKLDDLIAQQPNMEWRLEELAASDQSAAFALEAASSTFAFSQLQRIIESSKQIHGGEIVSVQMVEVQNELDVGHLKSVGLTLNWQANLKQAMGFVHELESGRPMVFVQDFTIDAEPHKNNQFRALNLSATIVGYWQPGLDH